MNIPARGGAWARWGGWGGEWGPEARGDQNNIPAGGAWDRWGAGGWGEDAVGEGGGPLSGIPSPVCYPIPLSGIPSH